LCAAVLAALEVSSSAALLSQLLLKSPTALRRCLRSSKINYPIIQISWHSDNALAECESTLLGSQRVWEHLGVLRSTGEVAQSEWEDCVMLMDGFTIC